jgi:hypothetical protein
MGVIIYASGNLAYRMNKKSAKNIDHPKKTAVQNIKNPFLRLMKWIENARKSDTDCKG